MDSPSNTILNLISSLRRRFSKGTSLKSFSSPNSRMNPRIPENDLNLYQKDPEAISPKPPTLSRSNKTLNRARNLEINIENFQMESSLQDENVFFKNKRKKSIFVNKHKPFLKIDDKNDESSKSQPPQKPVKAIKTKKKTLFEVLSNFYLTKKFINNLKSVTSKRTPKFLSKFHFDLINDAVFYFDIWKNKNKNENENVLCETNKKKKKEEKNFHLIIEKSKQKLGKYFEKVEVFDVSSKFILIWDFVQIFLILFLFFIIPVEICFNKGITKEYEVLYYLYFSSFWFFLIDIIVKCNTSLYLKGKLIKKRGKIMKHYIKSYFFRDLISIFCIFMHLMEASDFEITSNFIGRSILNLLFFLRVRNFFKILKNMEEMFFLDQSIHHIISLSKLIFRIVLLSHIFACLWYYIGTLYPESNWLEFYNLTNENMWKKYLYSYYFVCITMNTVGFGDIAPQNSVETLFTIAFVYVACVLFAYSINSIGMILSDIAKKEKEFQRNLSVINGFMKKKHINFELQMRVRKYLEYIWYEEKIEKIHEETKILDCLSDSLKEELLLEANGSVIRDLKMFTLNFSEELLRATVPLLKEVRFTPEDIIFIKGEQHNNNLYILKQGKIEVFLDTNKISVLKTLGKGETFGEISFFSDKERVACARSVDFTSVFAINKEEFVSLLKKFPHDYERYCQIKDKITLYDDYSDLYIKCYSCQESNHNIQNCSLIKYKPIKDIILNRHFISLEQGRGHALRKSHRFQTLKKRSIIEKKSFEIQANLFPIHDSEITSNDVSDYSELIEGGDSFEIPSKEDNNQSLEESKEQFSLSCREGNIPALKSQTQVEFGEISPNSKRFSKILQRTISSNKEKNPNKKIPFLDKIETQVYAALFNDTISFSNSSANQLSNTDASKINGTCNENKKKINDISERKMLKSLLNYISQMKEGKTTCKEPPKGTKENQETPSETKEEQPILQTETIKHWEFYFPYNNSEQTIEAFNLLNIRKIKSCKGKGNFFQEKRGGICLTSRRKVRESNLLSATLSPSKKFWGLSSSIRKTFFQSSYVIQKLKSENQFDIDTFKKNYNKKISQKNKMKNLWAKIQVAVKKIANFLFSRS